MLRSLPIPTDVWGILCCYDDISWYVGTRSRCCHVLEDVEHDGTGLESFGIFGKQLEHISALRILD